ncbi:hypothetical protein HQ531_08815 [bacterium]|nr:hypothetical protein [bacterium]
MADFHEKKGGLYDRLFYYSLDSMIHSKIHIVLLLIALMIPPGISTTFAASDSDTLDNRPINSLSFGIEQLTPFSFIDDDISSIRSRSTRSDLQYKRKWRAGRFIQLGFFQDQSHYVYKDSTGVSTSLNDDKTMGLNLDYQEPVSLNHNIRFTIKFTDILGIERLQLTHIAQFWEKIFIQSYLLANQSRWNLKLRDNQNDIRLSIHRFQSSAGLRFKLLSIGIFKFDFRRSFSSKFSANPDADMHMLLLPFSRSLEISLGTIAGMDRFVTLFYKNSLDTTNSNMIKNDETIGKFYALDQAKTQFGISMDKNKNRKALSYIKLTGDLSGYALAAPFGSLISQLSGARFYQKLELKLSYLDFSIIMNKQLNHEIEIGLHNSVLWGKGELYSRNYIFQVFNPISDLSIQEISINSFIMDDIDFQIKAAIQSNIILIMEGGLLLPLHLDYEAHPATPINSDDLTLGNRSSYDLTLGARLNVQIHYKF